MTRAPFASFAVDSFAAITPKLLFFIPGSVEKAKTPFC